MTSVIALMLDDDGHHHGLYPEVFDLFGITLTVVPNSEAAFDALQQIQRFRQPLDVFITDQTHPGIPGPEVIRRIRNLPDDATMFGGLRIRHLPIVVHSASADLSRIAEIDRSIICVRKPSRVEDLANAIDLSLRAYHEKVLQDLHYAGLGIQWSAGRFELVRGFTIPVGRPLETTYIDTTDSIPNHSALQGYRRLVLVLDREWSAQQSLLELEALLNHGGTTERDLQAFFRLHPDFLYREEALEHWAEPRLADQETGKVLRPDFLLKSLCLPGRPWSWQIVDLKGPGVPLVTDHRFHAKLSHHVHKVVAQLRTYSEYFESPHNRATAAALLGAEIRKPQLVAIIGRLPKGTLLNEYARLRGQVLDVSLVTYDEILEFRRARVNWRRSRTSPLLLPS